MSTKSVLLLELKNETRFSVGSPCWTAATAILLDMSVNCREPSVIAACHSNAKCSEICETGWKPTRTEIMGHQSLYLLISKALIPSAKLCCACDLWHFVSKTFLCDAYLASCAPGVHSSLCTSSCKDWVISVRFQTNITSCLQMFAKYWNIMKIYSNFWAGSCLQTKRRTDGRTVGRKEGI